MCLPVKSRDGGTADLAKGEGELSLSSGLQDLEVSLSLPVLLSSCWPVSRFLPMWLMDLSRVCLDATCFPPQGLALENVVKLKSHRMPA